MAFSANKLGDDDINGGNPYIDGSGFTPSDFNKAVEGVLWLNGKVGSGSSSGGTTVEANPSGTATSTLNKIKIANTIYSIPQGSSGSGGGSTIYKHTFDLYNESNNKIGGGYFYAITSQDLLLYEGFKFYENPQTKGNIISPILYYEGGAGWEISSTVDPQEGYLFGTLSNYEISDIEEGYVEV